MTTTDMRPAYAPLIASASVQQMVKDIPSPVICLVCSDIASYHTNHTVVINKGKRDGYVCGATCATRLIRNNTANNSFTFITTDREITLAGQNIVK